MSSAVVETQDNKSRPFGVYVILLLMLLQLIVSITGFWTTSNPRHLPGLLPVPYALSPDSPKKMRSELFAVL